MLKDIINNCPLCMDVRQVEMLEFNRILGAEINEGHCKGGH